MNRFGSPRHGWNRKPTSPFTHTPPRSMNLPQEHLALTLLLGLLAPTLAFPSQIAAQSTVHSVGPGHLATIQMAVDVAVDGDSIRVDPGTYPGFVLDGKNLTIRRAQPLSPDPVVINGQSTVSNLQAGGITLIEGLTTQRVFSVINSFSHLRIVDCTFKGANTPFDGEDGLRILNSRDLAISGCSCMGGNAGGGLDFLGGNGILIASSDVALYEVTALGGKGADTNSTIIDGGAGGAGLALQNASMVFLMAGDLTGGPGGIGASGVAPNGDRASVFPPNHLTYQSTPFLPDTGAFEKLLGRARTLSGPTLAANGATVSWTINGAIGEEVLLYFSLEGLYLPSNALGGVLLVDAPYSVQPAGSLLSQTNTLSAPLPTLPGASLPAVLGVQAVHILPTGGRVLGGSWTLAIQ